MWWSFGVLVVIAAGFSVLNRTEKRVNIVAGDLKVEY